LGKEITFCGQFPASLFQTARLGKPDTFVWRDVQHFRVVSECGSIALEVVLVLTNKVNRVSHGRIVFMLDGLESRPRLRSVMVHGMVRPIALRFGAASKSRSPFPAG